MSGLILSSFFYWGIVVRLLQLTDLHVFAEPGVRLKGIPTRETLHDVVEFIRSNEAPFDHVIVTGDHTHDERPESYQAVADVLSCWRDRLHVVPGNHDDRAVLREVFGDMVPGSGTELINFRIVANGWLLVGLDTHVPGQVPGLIDQAQVDWLRQCADQSDAASIAVFLHHPPVDVGSVWMDAIGLEGRELLQASLRDLPQIRLLCCGHVHHEFMATCGNAMICTTPSTGVQFDPSGSSATFAADAPGYRVVEFDGPSFSTHVVRLPDVKYKPVDD